MTDLINSGEVIDHGAETIVLRTGESTVNINETARTLVDIKTRLRDAETTRFIDRNETTAASRTYAAAAVTQLLALQDPPTGNPPTLPPQPTAPPKHAALSDEAPAFFPAVVQPPHYQGEHRKPDPSWLLVLAGFGLGLPIGALITGVGLWLLVSR
jgi:hypothetical protein